MADDRWTRLEELYHAAAELDRAERDAFVSARCGDDIELREELEALLAGHDATDADFLASPSLPDRGVERGAGIGAGIGAGSRIGRYRIVRVLGAGGIGTVFEAEQENPSRRVALKVMRLGLDAGDATRRFRHEAEILARLRHPGIAQVLDAGTHGASDESSGEEGGVPVPWFAMELIADALPITEYAESAGLSLEQRLELFVGLCEAIQHGHDNGVVHRDLKPHNVLVDSQGRVKVIDFGVARVTNSDLQLSTILTGARQLIGTIAYMSPEQCSGRADRVDSQSDVYSLGVLLYEMITGRLPYDLSGVDLPEMVRIVRDVAPVRPSVHVRGLSSDVEAILLRALEKSPKHRFDSVAEFAADVRRYLDQQPITSRAPSVTYHFRLFARRNKALLAALVVVFVSLVTATAVSTGYAIQASRRAAEATAARDEMDVERNAALQMFEFLEDLLAGANPLSGRGDRQVRELLDLARDRIDARFAEHPRIRARLHNTLGDAYRALSRYADARVEVEKALVALDGASGDSRYERATSLAIRGTVEMLERKLVDADASVSEALRLRTELLGPESPIVGRTLGTLGTLKSYTGEFQEAAKLLEQSIALIGDDAATAIGCANLGASLYRAGKFAEAGEFMGRALEMWRAAGLGDDVFIAATLANHALVLQWRGELEKAMQGFQSALRMFQNLQGKYTDDVASTRQKLAFLYLRRGMPREAEEELQGALAIRRKLHGDSHVLVALTQQMIGYVYITEARFEDAAAILRPALETQRAKLPPGHAELAGSLVLLGRAMTEIGQAAAAEPLLSESVRLRRGLGATHHRYAAAVSALAHCWAVLGRFDEAEPKLLECHEILLKVVGPDDLETKTTRVRLRRMYERWEKPEKAAAWR